MIVTKNRDADAVKRTLAVQEASIYIFFGKTELISVIAVS